MVNAEQPTWLTGLTEMTRTFGLELMESVLTDFPHIFIRVSLTNSTIVPYPVHVRGVALHVRILVFQHTEFSFLLKERVCPLIIKLFSPSLKYKLSGPTQQANSPGSGVPEKPYFPIVMRLLRVVSILIKNYAEILVIATILSGLRDVEFLNDMIFESLFCLFILKGH